MTDTNGNEGTENENRESGNLSNLASDTAHPFDQTNGIVDGLEGDLDDPEKVNERIGEDNGANVAPANSQLGGSAVAPSADIDSSQNQSDLDISAENTEEEQP